MLLFIWKRRISNKLESSKCSLHLDESPAILPKAQTHWLLKLSLFPCIRLNKIGMIPASINLYVCSDVPDAIFVKIHAISNLNWMFFSSSIYEKRSAVIFECFGPIVPTYIYPIRTFVVLGLPNRLHHITHR